LGSPIDHDKQLPLSVGDSSSEVTSEHPDTPGGLDVLGLGDSGYTIRLDGFDGPLDLLLQLIRKNEMDIFDVPISRLTSAYLTTLKAMEKHGIEVASDFLLMAATLTQLKSKLLLPRQDIDEDTGEEIDPRTELIQQLLAYQAFKEAATALNAHIRLGRDVFIRPRGQDRPPTDDPELPGDDMYRLARAFRQLIKKQPYVAPHEIYVERITIGERIAQIADRLGRAKRVSFASLIEDKVHREEVITTFLALLEMARLKLIRVDQRQVGSPLYVEAQVDAISDRGEKAAGMLRE